LHTAALDADLDPALVKPLACRLWPLALSEDPIPVLSVQEEAYSFACNHRRSGKGLHVGVRALLAAAFGAEAALHIEEHVAQDTRK
jgi:hypothetical protein